jgi:uncharacterized paraquat-inducible protein A
MHRLLFMILVLVSLAALAACSRRMAPFAPHRTNTDFHREAHANQACLGCHQPGTLSGTHQAADDCLRCHRILQGE